MKVYLSFILSLLCLTQLWGGENDKVIKLTYKISYSNIGEDLSWAKSLLPNTQHLYIKDHQSMVVLSGGHGGDQKYIVNNKDGNVLMMMNAMGKKFVMKSTLAEMNLSNILFQEPSYTLENETKKIAGHLCKKANIELKDGKTVVAYYTSEIKRPKEYKDLPLHHLPGIALEYTQNIAHNIFSLSALYKCTNSEEIELNDNFFTIEKGLPVIEKSDMKRYIQEGLPITTE